MTKLGIIGAMTIEIETLKEHMETMQLSTRSGMEFCEGKLEGLVIRCYRVYRRSVCRETFFANSKQFACLITE